MKKVDQIIEHALRNLVEQGGEEPEMPEQGGGAPEGDITQPDPEQAGAPPEKPAPLTSKGEEYLLKLAYLALLYTPKDDEMMQIKNTFESSGIHDENAIRAEEPQSIQDVKNILVNVLGANNTTRIADQLNDMEGPTI
jgi:hypothetical protein